MNQFSPNQKMGDVPGDRRSRRHLWKNDNKALEFRLIETNRFSDNRMLILLGSISHMYEKNSESSTTRRDLLIKKREVGKQFSYCEQLNRT
jgi:hypothetical protein